MTHARLLKVDSLNWYEDRSNECVWLHWSIGDRSYCDFIVPKYIKKDWVIIPYLWKSHYFVLDMQDMFGKAGELIKQYENDNSRQ